MEVLVSSGARVFIPHENVDKIIELKKGQNTLIQHKSGDKTWSCDKYSDVMEAYTQAKSKG